MIFYLFYHPMFNVYRNGQVRQMIIFQQNSTMMDKPSTLALYCGDFAFEQDYLTKYLICGVCDMILRNPMRLHSCGHTFCDKCVIISNICAICDAVFVQKQPDLIASNLVADSIVKCLAKDCPFRGTYENYINTHKNNCKLKNYNGLQNWMQKVKQSIDQIPKLNHNNKRAIINCEQVQIQETVKPNIDNNSVIIEQASNFQRFSQLQSLVIQNKVNKRIQVDSLYQINPQNANKVMQQMKQFKETPAARRCQYGKNCKLMLQEGGCPYIHPQKDPRRHYQLENWANIPVVRPPNNPVQLNNELLWKEKQDTRHFMNQFFPSIKPVRKRQVQIIPPPFPKNKKNKKKVIQL